ncbi:MAG: AbrB/MazE/SpoVT family DNA-binding domain-containing protein [Leptospiraceae bacterium]|nr:AbrB/MazE/SpoVT family DNA-binding domain-containing protein [Leptospiraceae bacterium]
MEAVLDRTGRIVIPHQVRENLNLLPGDELEVLVHGLDIVLRVKRKEQIKEENGMYLVKSEWEGETDIHKILQKTYSDRAKELL